MEDGRWIGAESGQGRSRFSNQELVQKLQMSFPMAVCKVFLFYYLENVGKNIFG